MQLRIHWTARKSKLGSAFSRRFVLSAYSALLLVGAAIAMLTDTAETYYSSSQRSSVIAIAPLAGLCSFAINSRWCPQVTPYMIMLA